MARRIEYLPIGKIAGANRNPKAHAGVDIEKAMGRFGYTEPLLLDERTQRLVAGHGRLEALQQLSMKGGAPPAGIHTDEKGEWAVPVVRGWASKDDREADAYLLASNRLTEAGGWHDGALAEILAELREANALEGLGFDNAYLTKLLDEQAPRPGKTDPDDVPAVPTGPLRVAVGDVWHLGEHFITCGDCTQDAVVDRVMGKEQARVCFTDPPWNVALGEDDFGGKKKLRPIANDNMGDRFPEFCRTFARQIARAMVPGGMLYLVMSTSEWPVIDGTIRAAGFHWSSTIIWAKDRLILTRKDYHTQYEPLWYGWKDGAARLVPLEDRQQSDLWVGIKKPQRSDEHPTMKPVELVTRALKNSSHLGDIVFEPFSGSGSTLIACEQSGRRCRAIELEPKYVQVAIERWEGFTGRIAKKG